MTTRQFKRWLPALIAASIFLGMFIGYRMVGDIPQLPIGKAKKGLPLQEVLGLIERNYVDKVDEEKLKEFTLRAILKNLDPFSVYISPSDLGSVNEQLSASFQGIGVEYVPNLDTPIVIRCTMGGGAARAGLLPGDRLLQADTNSLINTKDIGRYVKGKSGSFVYIKVRRQEKVHTFKVMRGTIPILSSHIAYLLRPGIGYIKLDKFSTTSHEELRKYIRALRREGMQKMILDLRDNRGGLLESALDIAGEFLTEGKLIAYTQNERGGRKKEYRNRRNGIFKEGPLVVLINKNSASASEIVAGSLQDWDRAVVIGENSFGKGLVQEQYTLANHGALRLTIAKYYTPSGRCIQKNYLLNEPNSLIAHDSMDFKVDTFYTVGGNIVLSSGGITPNIPVAQHLYYRIYKEDTAVFLRIATQAFFRPSLMRVFADNYIQWRDTYKDPIHFLNYFKVPMPLLHRVFGNVKPSPSPRVQESVREKIKLDFLALFFEEQNYLPLLLEKDATIKASLSYLSAS